MIIREYDSNGNQCYFRSTKFDARDLEDVAGVFDENFNVRVNAYIDGEDFCDAVRRCLIHDLIAGLMEEDDDDERDKHY